MKNPWIAGILSFVFPGIGHLYLGKVKKGLLLVIINIISILTIGLIVGIFGMLIVWIYSIFDSVKLARTSNAVAT
ncbi:hypothetical protein GPDM_01020 [Planococcus donghaensis MPA1U2]|uniref:DUF6677 domain-containing protein n=1 Tax=Planococcus donghaensis MPA1U2 TaxID=933115 RepID=E7RCP0_9BACL|nr:DUF6677 family protein [Planococcus donghaensis]EGA91405.1 hypothetical protein GPDM_01020 [Planococcus donghaensis MPA1U2]